MGDHQKRKNLDKVGGVSDFGRPVFQWEISPKDYTSLSNSNEVVNENHVFEILWEFIMDTLVLNISNLF